MAKPAPYFAEVAEGPSGGHAVWVTAADGVRLRIGIWPQGRKGTVLLFPGRSEYIEKYGRAADTLAGLGFALMTIDWRGQGLADRALDDHATGHVLQFSDYQLDVAALVEHARADGLPEPYFLISHSMGGCIALRAVLQDLPVRAAVFTAPMWGVAMNGALRPLAWSVAWASRAVGLDHVYTPGTRSETYVSQAPFEGNVLTTDRDMFDYMQRQLAAHPDLALGGPSLRWLYEALAECRNLAEADAPDLPAVTFLGSNERVVDTSPVHARMARWPRGRLELVEGAEHEVMMETPAIRTRVFGDMAAHFAANA